MARLFIENIAVIEKADIEFTKGLNILTGETGAGKSILINSILAVLGERTSRELIRTGAASAFVSAEFRELGAQARSNLSALGFEPEDDTVIISRELKTDGKAGFRINGRPCTAAILKEAGRQLINIHGQHESQSLLDAEKHIFYIDSMLPDKAVIERYSHAYAQALAAKAELSRVSLDESEKARKIDLLQYQIKDISSAKLRRGEQEELKKQREALLNYESIREGVCGAYQCIDGSEDDSGAMDAIKRASELLRTSADYDDSLSALCERLKSLCYELEDCGYELRDRIESMEYDPSELERIEDRLDEIRRLAKKYGGEDEALSYLAKAKQELEEIELSDEKRAKLELLFKKRKQEAKECAQNLHSAREKTAQLFSSRVREELSFLEMPAVSFEVSMKEKLLSQDGADELEFLISANPGEPPKPLAKIASGGELSRIMLAIKNVLAQNDDIDTLIFDEVDSGVSGRAAQKIGVKLKESSSYRQIICVTHLAQIAAFADSHMLIEKQIKDGRTYTNVRPLSYEDRIGELARINSGENVTKSMLDTCREMLDTAQKKQSTQM